MQGDDKSGGPSPPWPEEGTSAASAAAPEPPAAEKKAAAGDQYPVGLNPTAEEWKPPVAERRQAPAGPDRLAREALHRKPAAASITPQDLLGGWADSLGNAILVSSLDAYQLRLNAILSQPPRKDINLSLRPTDTGGWICGNALLDPTWSSPGQLHWITGDGKVSVWIRLEGEA